MGEHGKRAAAKAAASGGTAAPKAGTPHGRNHATRVQKDRSRRWGPLTAETAIVLGVAAAIIAGAFVVEAVQPASERTNTISGKDTVIEHNLGKGGIKPGILTEHTVVPQPVKTTGPTALPTTTAKPGKTPKPTATTAPTTDPGGVIPGGGTGGPTCTPIPLIRTCPDVEPDPGPVDTPAPEVTPDPTTGTQSNTASKATSKKKPTPSPESVSR